MCAKYIDNPPLLSTQSANGLENRQISLTRPVMFQTLPAANPNTPIRSDAPCERVDQSGLADTRLSCNKYDLAFPLEHLFEPAPHPRDCFAATHNAVGEICGTQG